MKTPSAYRFSSCRFSALMPPCDLHTAGRDQGRSEDMNEFHFDPQDVLRVLSEMYAAGLGDTLDDLSHHAKAALDLAPKRPDGFAKHFRLDELAPLAATLCFLFDCIADELPRRSCEGGAQ
jgi:hypothetical protein